MSTEDKKETNKEVKKKVLKKRETPVKPDFYIDGEINMPSSMLKNKDSFLAIWEGNLRKTDINEAWKRAEKWLSKYN